MDWKLDAPSGPGWRYSRRTTVGIHGQEEDYPDDCLSFHPVWFVGLLCLKCGHDLCRPSPVWVLCGRDDPVLTRVPGRDYPSGLPGSPWAFTHHFWECWDYGLLHLWLLVVLVSPGPGQWPAAFISTP